MKRRVASILLSMAMVATMVPANLVMAAPNNGEAAVQSTESEDEGSQEENLGMNVATRAKASASYTNKYSIDPAAMNDGKLATAEASTSWNSWGGKRCKLSGYYKAYLGQPVYAYRNAYYLVGRQCNRQCR